MGEVRTLTAERSAAANQFTPAVPAGAVAGVRCDACRRMHLPATLWPLAIRARGGGVVEIELRCARCNATGPLILDGNDPAQLALLAVWRDQLADHAREAR